MHLKLIAPLAAGLALAACTKTAPPVLQASDPRNDGIAKTCTPSVPDMSAPNAAATIAMTNDGWCGVFAVEKDGQPFSLGLVRARPEHGRVFIQKVGNATRVEYTPDTGYVGADAFTVALRSKTASLGDVPLKVAVTTTQGEQPAVAAPPPAKPSTPAKRSTTTKRRTTSSSR